MMSKEAALDSKQRKSGIVNVTQFNLSAGNIVIKFDSKSALERFITAYQNTDKIGSYDRSHMDVSQTALEVIFTHNANCNSRENCGWSPNGDLKKEHRTAVINWIKTTYPDVVITSTQASAELFRLRYSTTYGYTPTERNYSGCLPKYQQKSPFIETLHLVNEKTGERKDKIAFNMSTPDAYKVLK